MLKNRCGTGPQQAAAAACALGACLVLCGCPSSSSDSSAGLRLGYCPTMSPHAGRISERVTGAELEAYETAARALQNLRARGADAVLIGRLARSSELDALAVEVRLGSGHTLIRRRGGLIEYSALGQIRVHTAVDPATAAKLLPATTAIVRHSTLEDAVREGLDEAVLISWDDFRDEHQLLIPVESGAKVASFRLPTLYHHQDVPGALIQEIVRGFNGE